MNKIDSFSGPYRFLSNFYPAPVLLDNVLYPSTEHAFQAAKTTGDRSAFLKGTPTDAKRLGRRVALRPDWEAIKIDVMLDLLRQKFNGGGLRTKLLATGDAELIEGNMWGDRFWGVYRGVGENHLGRLLMRVRAEIAAEDVKEGAAS